MKNQKLVRKIAKSAAAFLLAVVTGMTAIPQEAQASSLPYQPYNYNYWEDIVFTPAAYEPRKIVSGLDFTYEGEPIGAFVTLRICASPPQGMCISRTPAITVSWW